MRSLPAIIVVSLFALVLSGCIQGDPPEPVEDDSGARVTKDTGSIIGVVGSEQFEPLEGAEVAIVEEVEAEVALQATTGTDGSFAINGVPPGRYTLWASAPGYDSVRLPVQVAAGQVVEKKFLLPILGCAECPYEEIREYVGIIRLAASWQAEAPAAGCVVQPTSVWTAKTCGGIRYGNVEDNGEVAINVTEGAQTLFAALVWNPAGPLGESLSLDLMCDEVPRGSNGAVLDTEHPCYYDTPSTQSPIIHRLDGEDEWEAKDYDPTGDWAARVFGTYGMLGTYGLTGIDVGAAYEQRFEIYTEVWVNHAAPADHRPIPDG